MSFKNIKGQDAALNLLQSYLQHERLSAGYLFTGPEGVGKKMAAQTLAKALNCHNGPDDTFAPPTAGLSIPSPALGIFGEDTEAKPKYNPKTDLGLQSGDSRRVDSCDECVSCRKIDAHRHPDIHEIEAIGAEIKIESIRQLQSRISLRPYEAKVKVFIIDNAHNLNPESSGALLKVLEEPPKNSLIILISDKPGRLYKTILSRCKNVKFTAFRRPELKAFFKKDYALTEEAAHFLAYFCEGRVGRALKLKEADILNFKNRVIDNFAFSRKCGAESLPLQDKGEVKAYMNILAAWFRDIYLVKIGLPLAQLINIDRKDEILRQMSRFSFPDLNEIMRSISDTLSGLERNINTRLLLHNLGAQICRD